MKFVKLVPLFLLLALLAGACSKNRIDRKISITQTELRTLFTFDVNKDVYENLELLKSFDKEKQYRINGKSVIVNRLSSEAADASQGCFKLVVSGTEDVWNACVGS